MRKILLLILVCCAAFSACRFGMRMDSADSKDRISILRYDKLLDEYIISGSFSSFMKMHTQYRAMTSILIEDILELGEVSDDTVSRKLKIYFSDTTLVRLRKDIKTQFKDLRPLEEQLEGAFAYLKQELPGTTVPRIYTQNSAFNESIILTDSLIGISLDKYMGKDYPLYHRFYYQYQRDLMTPERIAYDCIRGYISKRYPFNFDTNYCFLDLMLYSGRINYLVMKSLKIKDPSQYLGYSKEKAAWCKANEKNIWHYMVSNNHLKETDPMICRKYLSNAPFTAFFGKDAPPRVGTWIGIKIIESYIKKNPKISYEDLMHLNSSQILENSNYHLTQK